MKICVEICRKEVETTKIAVVWWKNEYFYSWDQVRKIIFHVLTWSQTVN